MKYPPNVEYEFDHPSGKFTGFVEYSDYSGWLAIRLTSPANGNLRIKEGLYKPGEIRMINPAKCRMAKTGKGRMIPNAIERRQSDLVV